MEITTTSAWGNLCVHAERLGGIHLRDLFRSDAQRAAKFSFENNGLLIDFSKQRLDELAFADLVELARVAGVERWRDAMFAGEAVNATENRSALHVALRATGGPFPRADFDVMPDVLATRQRMADFAESVRNGRWLGYTGQPIRNVVNIGIGGSDLGPKMATVALRALAHPTLAIHYVSNLDSAQLAPLLQTLDPRTTLFVITSKTFTTQETMVNALSARNWLVANIGSADAVRRHFVAVTTADERAAAFGVTASGIFPMWDWVGGRYSLWSAVGLSLMIAIGPQAFGQLLAGAEALDNHFRTAPLAQNLPVLMGLVGVWNTNFLGADTLAVLPYNESLRYLPSYLQQLEMESNGKSVGRDGQPVACRTTPILWGELGNNGQHAFFQLLHQGGRLIPCDFIVAASADFALPGHQEALLANCFAQTAALAFGKTADEARQDIMKAMGGGGNDARVDALVPHKTFSGNQPSTTILLPHLDPHALGVLIALYEHKVFVQSVIWNINPFDQWGVELGKAMARDILPAFQASGDISASASLDASTLMLVNYCKHYLPASAVQA